MDFKYPYTDYHELNLDWFLAQFKDLMTKWKQLAENNAEFKTYVNEKVGTMEQTVQSFIDFVNSYFDNLDVQQEINNKLDAMAASGELQAMLQPYFDNFVAQVNQRLAAQDSSINVINTRMDTFTHLTDGSTTGDAELADIRTGFNGVAYSDAGTAVRSCDDILHDDIAYTNINLQDDDISIISKTGGYYDVNGNFKTYPGWNCYKAVLSAILNYRDRINGTGTAIHSGTTIPSIVYLDVYGNVLSTSFTDTSLSSTVIAAPAGTFYICLNTTSTLNIMAITKNVRDKKDFVNSPLYAGKSYFDAIERFIFEYDFYNILSPATVKTSGYELINGVPTANATFTVYDFIECNMLKSVAVTRVTVPGQRGYCDNVKIAFYDENQTFICQLNNMFANVPDNAVYMRFSLPSSYTTTNYAVAVNNGEMPVNNNYVAYGETVVYKYRDFIGKKICTFGDSIAASDDGIRNANTWIKRTAEYFNCESYNRGIGGSCVTATKADGTPRTGYAYVDSDGDAGDIRVVYNSPQTFVDYPTEINPCMETAERCNTIPTDTDIVIIIAGANDTGSTTPDAFETAYKQMLENIQTRVPYAKIICCTMPYHKSYDYLTIETEYTRLRDRIRKAAAYYGFPVIELRDTMGVNRYNCDNYMSDNVHYNTTAGRKRIAECVINTLKGYAKL